MTRKRTRREQLIDAGAQLFAERGFHAVGVNDIGDAVGLTGPALYRHFPSKQALLVAVFDRVVDGILGQIREIVALADDPMEALELIVAHHVSFAIDDRELLATWRAELLSLPEDDRRRLRHAQRVYVEEWVATVTKLRPDLTDAEIRTIVHAAIGLIQSPMDYHSTLGRDQLMDLLSRSALAALLERSGQRPEENRRRR